MTLRENPFESCPDFNQPPLWCSGLPREQEVVGLIPCHDRSKSFKLLVVALPLGAQDYGKSTMAGQDNGLVKIVQETWICELSPLNN